MTSAQAIARFSSLMLSALSTGVFFGTRTSLGPSTKDFTPSTYVEVQQATIRNLRPVMGALLPAAVVANAVVVILSRRDARSTAFRLASGGLAAQVPALTLTVAIELPINAQVLTWAPDEPPHGWEATRDRWAWVHTARTTSSLVGLTCLAAALSDCSSQQRIRLRGLAGMCDQASLRSLVTAESEFWAGLLGGEVHPDEGWHSVTVDGEGVLGVQAVPGHVPPDWPTGLQQQQVHLDLHVDDLQEAHQLALALGGRQLQAARRPADNPNGDEMFAVYASPAGHPFCFGVH